MLDQGLQLSALCFCLLIAVEQAQEEVEEQEEDEDDGARLYGTVTFPLPGP